MGYNVRHERAGEDNQGQLRLSDAAAVGVHIRPTRTAKADGVTDECIGKLRFCLRALTTTEWGFLSRLLRHEILL